MDSPKTLEGAIHLDLGLADGAIDRVRITSTRPVDACKMLVDLPVDDGLKRLSMMFSMCGAAHTVAGLRAAEQALGLTASVKENLCRDLLVLAEAAEQTILRILLDWPLLLGDKPAIADVVSLRSVLHVMPGLVEGKADWKIAGGAGMKPDCAALDKAVDRFGGDILKILLGTDNDEKVFSSLQDLKFWWETAATVPAKMLRKIHQDGLAGFGSCETAVLQDLDMDWLEGRLGADDNSFVTAPDCDGVLSETGPLRTLKRDRLVQEVLAAHGTGLLARLLARIMFLVRLPRRMRSLVGQLQVMDGAADGVVPEKVGGTGVGLAQIDTARGLLVHRIEVEDGRIARYQTLAPTEWNFHPAGPLYKGLLGAKVSDDEDMKRKAALMMTALDPCIAFDVSVMGAG